jgi:hypothetical protein
MLIYYERACPASSSAETGAELAPRLKSYLGHKMTVLNECKSELLGIGGVIR